MATKTKALMDDPGKQQQLIANARVFLADFDIPWERYDGGAVCCDVNEPDVDIEWKHLKTGTVIAVCSVWWDEDTMEVLQCGRNSGELHF